MAMPRTSWNKRINIKFLGAAFERAGIEKYLGSILFSLTSSSRDVADAAINELCFILQRKGLNRYERRRVERSRSCVDKRPTSFEASRQKDGGICQFRGRIY